MSTSSGSFVDALGHNWLGKADIAVQSVLLAVGVIAVALRVWSRRLLGIAWQGSDWLILAALVVITGRYVVELSLILLCGMGLHVAEIFSVGGEETLVEFRKVAYAGDLLWITVVALVQLSILHYYLRQFQHRVIGWLIYMTISLSLALWAATFFATAFLCTPVKKIWLPNTDGHCGDRRVLHLSATVTEAIVDAFILSIPIPMLSHMRLSTSRKLAIGGIYLLGLIVIAATLIRIKTDYDLNTEDLTYSSARKSLILCIVPLIGIIVACLPIIPPALERLFGTTRFSSPSEGTTTYGYMPSGYYKTTVLSGAQMEEPEIPLVSVDRPPMAKKLSEWCQGQIKITSDWEIHSTRNSARLDKDSIRRA